MPEQKAKLKGWSYSRLTTWNECKLKYILSYCNKWYCSVPPDTEAADKGSCFHETVEHYFTGMSEDLLYKILDWKINYFGVDTTKYDERAAIERFLIFWRKLIVPKQRAGFRVQQEFWAHNQNDDGTAKEGILTEPFIGGLDLSLYYKGTEPGAVNMSNNPATLVGTSFSSGMPSKPITIFDYKSAPKVEITKYKKQLMLYAYLTGFQRGWTLEEIADRIELKIFFPFAEVNAKYSGEDAMLAAVREVQYDVNDLKKTLDGFIQTINEIHAIDFNKVIYEYIGNPQFKCKWCQFCGGVPNDDGFPGCAASIRMGKQAPAGATYSREYPVRNKPENVLPRAIYEQLNAERKAHNLPELEIPESSK